MKKQVKFIVFIVLVIVIIGGIGIWANNNQTPSKYEQFAKCINDSGAKFYGTFWCSHCQNQKKMFDSSAKYLPYVECSSPNGQEQLQVCKDAGIEGYPTWVFSDGKRLSGELSFETLAQNTNCPLPQ